MTMIVNVSSGTRNLFGVQVGPGEMATVDADVSDLKKHLFVKCGDIEVPNSSAPKASKSKGKQSKDEQPEQESTEGEGSE